MRIETPGAASYNHDVKLRDARQAYFEENDFGEDGGYSKPTATVYLFGLPVSFPNSEGRKKAVVFHDLHHVLTGYKTNNLGEAEISAWELGSGCFSVRFAWVINTMGLILGIFKDPSRIYRAFVRGRHSQNTYGKNAEQLLECDVQSVQQELNLLGPKPQATPKDTLAFLGYLTLTFTPYALTLATLFWVFS